MYIGLNINYQLFSSDFNGNWIFLAGFRKILEYQMKIPTVGAELFYADGQTDMTKLIVTFRNFANAPKKI
jgi:hypothetical protein